MVSSNTGITLAISNHGHNSKSFRFYSVCSLCYRLNQWFHFTVAATLISFESIAGIRLTKRPIDWELNLNTTVQHNQRLQLDISHRSTQPTKPVVCCSIPSLQLILHGPNPQHIFSLKKDCPQLYPGMIKTQMFAVRFRRDVVTNFNPQAWRFVS